MSLMPMGSTYDFYDRQSGRKAAFYFAPASTYDRPRSDRFRARGVPVRVRRMQAISSRKPIATARTNLLVSRSYIGGADVFPTCVHLLTTTRRRLSEVVFPSIFGHLPDAGFPMTDIYMCVHLLTYIPNAGFPTSDLRSFCNIYPTSDFRRRISDYFQTSNRRRISDVGFAFIL